MSLPRMLALGCLALAAATGCGDGPGPALRVELRAIPGATRTIEAQLGLDGHPALEPTTFTAPAGGFHDVESFVVNLPQKATGALQLGITARDALGCVTAGRDGAIADVRAGRGLTLPLETAGRAGCSLTLEVLDPAHGSIGFGGGFCSGSCTVLLPPGSSPALTAAAGGDGAFLGWSGDCSGDGACAPLLDRPRRVSASFGARGLTFARGLGGSDGIERAFGVAFDALGNAYVVGTFGSKQLLASVDPANPVPPVASVGGSDAFVAKLDQTGRVLWAKGLGSPGDDDLQGVAVAGDQLYVAGTIDGAAHFDGSPFTSNRRTVIVLALSTDGQLRDGRVLDGPFPEAVSKLAIAGDGSLVLAGVTLKPGRQDGKIYALTPSLAPAGAFAYGGTLTDGSNNVLTWGLAFDPSGGVVASGSFGNTVTFAGETRTSAGREDAYVLGLTAGLEFRWVTTLGGAGNDEANGVAMMAVGGRLVVAGQLGDTMQVGSQTLVSQGATDSWAATLDPADGTPANAVSFGTPAYDGISAVAADANGNVAVIGFANLDAATLESEVFMAWLDPSLGTVRYEAFGGKADGDFAYAIAAERGNTVGVGNFSHVTYPGGRALASLGSVDAFVVRWSAWP